MKTTNIWPSLTPAFSLTTLAMKISMTWLRLMPTAPALAPAPAAPLAHLAPMMMKKRHLPPQQTMLVLLQPRPTLRTTMRTTWPRPTLSPLVLALAPAAAAAHLAPMTKKKRHLPPQQMVMLVLQLRPALSRTNQSTWPS